MDMDHDIVDPMDEDMSDSNETTVTSLMKSILPT
jgi:hypothetical protein